LTVPTTTSRAQYATNATTGPWTVPFYFLEDEHLEVIHTDSDGNETTLALTTNYSVSGSGDPAGGTVTTVTAYAAGGYITILRSIEPLQQSDYVEGGKFPAETLERDLDLVTMIVQQQAEVLARAMVFSPSDTAGSTLPAAAARASKLLGFDSLGRLSLNVPTEGSAAALALLIASIANAIEGSGMIGFDSDLDYPPDTSGKKHKQILHVEDEGAVGDGATDDEAAILVGLAKSAATGRELHFDGSKTYAIDAAAWTIQAGARLRTNGCTFKCLTSTTSNTVWLTLEGNTVLDRLVVDVPAGVRRDRAIKAEGDDITIEGGVALDSADVQATTDNDDCGIRFVGNRIKVGGVKVNNYDKPVTVQSSTHVDLGRLDFTSYTRGLYLLDSSHVSFEPSHIRTASPNASYTPGHVAVLISCDTPGATHDITMPDFVVEDCGEHALRIGGPETIYNVVAPRWRTKNTGGSALKVLGTDSGTPTNRNRDIWTTDWIAEDAGVEGALTSNMCGALIMFADRVYVTNWTVKKNAKTYAAYAGARVVAAGDVWVTGQFTDAQFDGVWADGSLGSIDRLHAAGIARACGRDGFRHTAGTDTHRRFYVDMNVDSNTGVGFTVAIGGGGLTDSLFRFKTHNNTAGAGACDSTAATLDVFGAVGSTPLSGITAQNGSRWSDGTTTNLRVGSAWIAQPVILTSSATYDPPSLADGTGGGPTVTCTGAAMGDLAQASFSNSLSGITLTAWVSAADTVSVRFQNESGSTLDLASGTLRVWVTKA
jgi:hypothetical protein